jgi:hypothetical protein
MKPKTIKITYWVLLALLCLMLAADGYGGITKQQAGIDALNHLGYPPYLLPLFGALKWLGVVALLQLKYTGIKEWVFAGVAFTFIGASYSHFAVKDGVGMIIAPLVALVFLFAVYTFWNKYEQVKNQPDPSH